MFNFLNKKKDNNSDRKIKPAIEFIQSITIAIGLSICIFAIITPSEVEGSSMEPNFHNGERVYTNRLPQWLNNTFLTRVLGLDYSRGDVIVFNITGTSISLIKRIVGLPGDKLEINNGNIYLNDQLLKESYLPQNIKTNSGTYIKEGEIFTIPQDSFFVAGDNRPNSNDSRYLGFIKKDWMQGKVLVRVWPLSRLGIIGKGESEFTPDKLNNN